MKHSLLLAALLAGSTLMAEPTTMTEGEALTEGPPTVLCTKAQQAHCKCEGCDEQAYGMSAEPSVGEAVLSPYEDLRISVFGQGVAPMTTTSPAQAYALAKRAAIADAYRLIAEKVKGVRVEGQDTIKNMMVQRSTIRTFVDAMVRRANVVETTFKEGLCEVEMEIVLSHSQFSH
jgi:hypothetical protein